MEWAKMAPVKEKRIRFHSFSTSLCGLEGKIFLKRLVDKDIQ